MCFPLFYSLPGITVLSHVGHLAITADKVPISLPAKHWTFDKLSYPWNIQLTDMSIATIQKEKYCTFLKRNTTNIIIAVNDIGTLSVDVHVDMKPLEVNFMFDQVCTPRVLVPCCCSGIKSKHFFLDELHSQVHP